MNSAKKRFPSLDRRSFLLGGVALGAATTLAACSSDQSSGGSSGTTAGGPVELRVMTWTTNEDHHALFNAYADEFIAANPDKVSKITFDGVAFADYGQALLTQISGGDAPDLAWINESLSRDFVTSGALYDLTEAFQNAPGYELDDIPSERFSLWEEDGATYGFPLGWGPHGLYANLDLIAAAGQPTPQELIDSGEWTWERIDEIAAAVNQATGAAGFAGYPSNVATTENIELTSWWAGWGAKPWSDDGSTCTIDSPEMIAFWEWATTGMYERGSFMKPGETVNFNAGEAAFTNAKQSTSLGLSTGTFAWDWLPLPEGPAGQVNVSSNTGFVAPATGKNPAVAADFLAYFTNPENSERMQQYFGTPRNSLLTVERFTETAPHLSELQIEQVAIGGAEGAIPLYMHDNYAEFRDVLQSGLSRVTADGADVAAELTALRGELDPYFGS